MKLIYLICLLATGLLTLSSQAAIPINPPPGICANTVCDNAEVGARFAGNWSASTTDSGYYGSNYLHDQASGRGSKTVQWNYSIGQAGKYTIAAQWSQASNRATGVQYRYAINGGAEQNCGARVSQRVNGGKMNVLCSIPALAANSTLTVILRNDVTNGFVIADAVRVEREASAVNTPPVATFTYYQVQFWIDRFVLLDASASTDDGTIVSYDWDCEYIGEYLGEVPPCNEIPSGAKPEWTPGTTNEGVYKVTLTVTDNLGATTSLTRHLAITDYTFYDPVLIDFGSSAYATANSLGVGDLGSLGSVYGSEGGLSGYGVSTTYNYLDHTTNDNGGWNGVSTSGSTTASSDSVPNAAWRDSIYISNRAGIAYITISGLTWATYHIEIGASQVGDDGGRGFYTNFGTHWDCGESMDPNCDPHYWMGTLNASNNNRRTIKFSATAREGNLRLAVRIDPKSSSRVGYISWLRIRPVYPYDEYGRGF